MKPPTRTSRAKPVEAPVRPTKVYYALNEFVDALEAVPLEVVRHLTLLREVDAKCVNLQSSLTLTVEHLLDEADAGKEPSARAELEGIREKLTEVLPCYEEKIHVSNTAGDAIHKHLKRLQDCYVHLEDEIPAVIRLGPKHHPAFMSNNASGAPSRSETRREAIAARRAEKDIPPLEKTPKRKRIEDRSATPVTKRRRQRDEGKDKPDKLDYKSDRVDRLLREDREDKDSSVMSEEDREEEIFCICRGVSYGEMVACDGENCKYEWFHLPCVKLDAPPKGRWYCPNCAAQIRREKRSERR